MDSVHSRAARRQTGVSLLGRLQVAEEVVIGIVALILWEKLVGKAWAVLHVGARAFEETL